jgi:hypothetical protein
MGSSTILMANGASRGATMEISPALGKNSMRISQPQDLPKFEASPLSPAAISRDS